MSYTEEEKKLLKVDNSVSIAIRGGKNIDDVYSDCTIKYIGSKYIVFVELATGREFTRKLSKLKFKPIDTRTDTEKAIDDLKESYDIWHKTPSEKGFIRWFVDDIKGGKITGVKWVGND